MYNDYALKRNRRSPRRGVWLYFTIISFAILCYHYNKSLPILKSMHSEIIPSEAITYAITSYNQIHSFLFPTIYAPSVEIINAKPSDKSSQYVSKGYSLETECLPSSKITPVANALTKLGYSSVLRPFPNNNTNCLRLYIEANNNGSYLSNIRKLLEKKSVTSTIYIAR